MSKYLLAGLLLLSAPALAETDINDGPVAIRPLTVIPKGYPNHPPITIPLKVQPTESRKVIPPAGKVCDFQKQCYSSNSTHPQPLHESNPHVNTAPYIYHYAVPPVKPAFIADAPLVSKWKNCMSRALGEYYQTHDQQELQMATNLCQGHLGQPTYNQPEELPQINPDGRRNIGCGWWPVGSDADRDCAVGRFNLNNEIE